MKLKYIPKNNIFYGWRCYRYRYTFKNLRSFFGACKGAYQRIIYGYAASDVWDMDDWVYRILPAMLRHLRDTTSSYPSKLMEKYGEEIAPQVWADILTEIANSIEYGNREYSQEYPNDLDDIEKRQAFEAKRTVRVKHGLALLSEWIDSMWD